MNESLKVQLNVSNIFETETIAEIAALIALRRTSD